MHATVRHWDAVAGGSALLDDGRELAFPPSALVGLRGLRLGQRVRLRVEGKRWSR